MIRPRAAGLVRQATAWLGGPGRGGGSQVPRKAQPISDAVPDVVPADVLHHLGQIRPDDGQSEVVAQDLEGLHVGIKPAKEMRKSGFGRPPRGWSGASMPSRA